MARTVTRIARAKASWPSVASRPLRCGSSEVWIAWKSCSGARVISSALKTTPARAVVAVALTVSTAALSSVCSASWIAATESGEAGAGAQRQRALVGRRRGDVGGGVAHDRPRHDEQRGQRRGEDAQRDRRLPVARPDRDGDREAEARHRLEQHEPAVEPEPLVAGQVAAGEVAGGVGERRADEDPVQRRRVEGVLDRAVQRERDDEEGGREAGLDEQRRCAAGGGRDGRARAGRRSSATAAARPGR